MESGQPSRTARAAGAHRAAHQILESGCIFADPLAMPLLGETPEIVVRQAEEHRSNRRMRLFVAARARFAEDALAAAAELGVSQVVVLGAGLDTYAYRGALRDHLDIFEVDHPATQAWKRTRLSEAGIPIPARLTFAPVNFERESLVDGLAAVGFNQERKTFFTWLGVVPYLTESAIWTTFGFIASLLNGAHVVFDYGDPPDLLSPEVRAFHDVRAARVEAMGERWVSYFEGAELRTKLLALGFSNVEDLGPRQISARYFGEMAMASPPPDRGAHIVHASTS
jgi:methyltransferase (TIGR00027 family)